MNIANCIAIAISSISLIACTGNVNVSGEMGGKYETNESHSYTKTVNEKVVEEVKSNTHSGGAFETDFNIVIGNGDTTIT